MIVNSDPKKLNKQVFKQFQTILNKLKEKKAIVIGLSGGSSILWFYEILKDNVNNIDYNIWKKIKFVFVDERIVPLDDKNSNYKLNKEYLFDFLLENNYIKQSQIITIDLNSKNIAEDYFSKVPHIDIWLLGVGPDGHTCSLFPKHKLCDILGISYLEIKDSPKPPPRRITISKDYLVSIGHIFIFFIWESKKEAFQRFLDPKVKAKDCPCKYVLNNSNYNIVTNIII